MTEDSYDCLWLRAVAGLQISFHSHRVGCMQAGLGVPAQVVKYTSVWRCLLSAW